MSIYSPGSVGCSQHDWVTELGGYYETASARDDRATPRAPLLLGRLRRPVVDRRVIRGLGDPDGIERVNLALVAFCPPDEVAPDHRRARYPSLSSLTVNQEAIGSSLLVTSTFAPASTGLRQASLRLRA